MLFPQIGMVFFDQPEERAVLCLKGRDGYMDCIIFTLPSRLQTESTATKSGALFDSSEDDERPDTSVPRRSLTSVRNIDPQLSTVTYRKRDLTYTIQLQLCVGNRVRTSSLSSSSLSSAHLLLV